MPGTHRSGRKRKSTVQHILNGNPSRINLDKERSNEPQWSVPNEVPKPTKLVKPPRKPALTGDIEKDKRVMDIYGAAKLRAKYAVKEWKRLAPELHEKGLLTNSATKYFEAYCIAYGNYAYATEMRKYTEDVAVLGENNKTTLSYWVRIQKESFDQMMKIEPLFGLTPSSASKVSAISPKKKIETLAGIVNKSNRLHRVK